MSTKGHVTLREILGDEISREDALTIISSSISAQIQFQNLSQERQEEILGFVQGIRGLPILYDGFYKYVLDPERHPERLESFLSDLFEQEVTIQEVLTKEGIQLAEAGTLVVMDIVVKLSDGSIVDVEMQKHGYLFTGERSSCYLSDMIMRQYNRVKAKEKGNFKFSQMKPVYLIIIMENSTREFKEVFPEFIHRLKYTMDTGVKLELLTNLTYISLDTFHEVSQNIDSNIEAWLTFLSSDKPEDIIKLVERYPQFKECYQDIVMFRKKPEELMNMFSEALIQMDKNTVKYMIEEQQKELEANQKELAASQKELKASQQELEASQKELAASQKELKASQQELEASQKELAASHKELEVSQKELKASQKELAASHKELETSRQEVEEKDAVILQLMEEIQRLKQQS